MTLMQLISIWCLGNPEDNIPPLSKFNTSLVEHFDKQGKRLSKMRQVMIHAETLGREKGVWVDKQWDGEKVTSLWSAVWKDMDPCLRTETQIAKGTGVSISLEVSGVSLLSCAGGGSARGRSLTCLLQKSYYPLFRQLTSHCLAAALLLARC